MQGLIIDIALWFSTIIWWFSIAVQGAPLSNGTNVAQLSNTTLNRAPTCDHTRLPTASVAEIAWRPPNILDLWIRGYYYWPLQHFCIVVLANNAERSLLLNVDYLSFAIGGHAVEDFFLNANWNARLVFEVQRDFEPEAPSRLIIATVRGILGGQEVDESVLLAQTPNHIEE